MEAELEGVARTRRWGEHQADADPLSAPNLGHRNPHARLIMCVVFNICGDSGGGGMQHAVMGWSNLRLTDLRCIPNQGCGPPCSSRGQVFALLWVTGWLRRGVDQPLPDGGRPGWWPTAL